MLKIVLADDHIGVRDMLKLFLVSCGHSVVATAADGDEALRAVREHHPQVLVTDFRMPQFEELVKTVRMDQKVDTRIVALSVSLEKQDINDALAAGVDGYVAKQSVTGSLCEAIEQVMAGNRYLCPLVKAALPEVDYATMRGE